MSESSITISYSTESTESSESESTESSPSSSSPSTESSSSSYSLSSISSTSSTSTSSSSSNPNCNDCDPNLNPVYTVTVGGQGGSCVTFNGAWNISWIGGCSWFEEIAPDYTIQMWWDDTIGVWYIFFIGEVGGVVRCGFTATGGNDPCVPTGNYTVGTGTVVVS